MTRKQLFFYCLAAMVLFSAFVLARFPAATALAIAGRYSGMIIPYQASGTIWQGRAENIYISYQDNLLELGVTRWRITAPSLLLGRLDLRLDAINGRQKISGDFRLTPTSLRVDDLQLAVELPQLLVFYPIPVRAEGFVELMLTEFAVANNHIGALDGNLVLRDSAINFSHPVMLGSYAARLSLDGDSIQANISDLDAMVALQGTAALDPGQREYRVDVNLRPRSQADPAIAQTLTMIASQNSDGSFRFQQSSRF